LHPERNPRKNEQAVDRMVATQPFGFQVPILARSGGEVVDGYLRIKAASATKWTPEQVNKEKRNP
jgi:ParB-like chromosome segregation protein Spo0J